METKVIEGFRLSPQQKHLWLLQQNGRATPYRVWGGIRIDGPLDVPTFIEAVRCTIERHEILRTVFRRIAEVDIPLQVITGDAVLSWQHYVLVNLSVEEQECRLKALFQDVTHAPFDLEQGPLAFVTIVTLSPVRRQALVCLPALCADAITLRNIVYGISQSYEAQLHTDDLTDTTVQYVDFAEWQSELLSADDFSLERRYWREKDVVGLLTPRLPFETRNGAGLLFDPETLNESIAPELLVRVEALSSQSNVAPVVFFLACWQLLLSRISGQSVIVMSITHDNRTAAELKHAIGLYAQNLPLVCHSNEQVSFYGLLAQLGSDMQDMSELQGYFSWDYLRESLSKSDSEPYFPFSFNWEDAAPEIVTTSTRISFSLFDSAVYIDRFRLRLSCVRHDASLHIQLHYDANLYSAADIKLLAEQYQSLISSALSHPRAAISSLSILSERIRQRVLFEFNRAEIHPPTARLLHHLFEEQAICMPDSLSLIVEEEQLTYSELNRRANHLAHSLQARGVGPEDTVVLCVERSPALLIGLLGILKAGGAYAPLDPTLPAERIAFMLEVAQAPVVVTSEPLRHLVAGAHTEALCLDADARRLARCCDDNPISQADEASAAYIMFTSGSTGRPKGVVVTHANVLHYLAGLRPILNLPTGARYASISTVAADLGNTVIFASLCHGGCLYLLSQEQATNPALLADYCRHHPIDCLKIVPSHLQALLWAEHAKHFLPGQWLILGGEALSWELVATVQGLRPECRILNHYGPTETTIGVLTNRVEPGIAHSVGATVPLGKPLSGTQCYVLDQEGQPAPIWAVGELYLGGTGLARGYLGQPELTAERFVPHPFSAQSGVWLYRTGDLVRWHTEGVLEFVGRIDYQVKIRGYRIELGEIEAILAQHPQVEACVVLARHPGDDQRHAEEPGDKRLVAYIVPLKSLPERLPRETELIEACRRHLEDRLPSYMIPTTFMVLEALPLTANGKVDRRALPAPDSMRQVLTTTYVGPRTPTETALVGIWARVLRRERIGVRDNFFALGGDSILSIQVIARAAQVGLRLTPRQMFQQQTIAELASVVGATAEVAAEQGQVTGSVSLTPIQLRFFEQGLAQPHHYNQSVLLTVRKPVALSALQQAVAHILAHHDVLRLRFSQTAMGWQQQHAGPEAATAGAAALVCTSVDLSHLLLDVETPCIEPAPSRDAMHGVSTNLQADEQARVLTEAASAFQASLKLNTGPLLRAVLFTLGPEQPARLLFVAHHLVVDGVSWRILLEDLQRLLEQASQEQPFSLPAKTTSFQQWAERLAMYAQSEVLLQEQGYWLAPTRTQAKPLPVDHVEGANTMASTRAVHVHLTVEETQALLQEAPRAYHTQIHEALLAALLLTYADWTRPAAGGTGERHLLVNLEGHGREDLFPDVDLSRTVGWFTSLFPVLLSLGADETPGAVLRSVKEQVRGIPQHGIGFGLLRYLSPSVELCRQLAALPEAEITFNYLGQFDQAFTSDSWFQSAPESAGPSRGKLNERRALLEVNALVVDGQLGLDWIYSEQRHERITIEKVARQFLAALRQLIAYCQSSEAGGYTPSDFPLAGLDQSQLDRLLGNEREIEDIYPLSPMQEGMLFHSLYDPTSGVFVEQMTCQLQGELDLAALRQAWQQVIARHTLLRTSFHWQDLAAPLQVVHQQVGLPWDEQDWRLFSPTQQEEQLEALLRADRARGFDLIQAPLLRLILLRLTDETYQFIWSNHHLLLDGWARSLLLREVFACYAANWRRETPYLPPSRPYRDYIDWLRRQDMTAAEHFWRQLLQGFTAPTPLIVDHAPSHASSSEGQYMNKRLQLGEMTTTALQAVAQRYALTMNTLVQGAWAVLLSRYSQQREVVFGSIVAGRPAELLGVESMIGLFINTLPTRARVASEQAVYAFLQDLQAQQAEARQYEYSPLAQVQGWSEVPRGMPLFESTVVFENYPIDNAVQDGLLSMRIKDARAVEQANYALGLQADLGLTLRLRLGYLSDRFEQASIERLLGHLQILLEAIATNPEQRVRELPLLTAAELGQVLDEWNATATPFPRDACIHDLFEQYADHIPDSIALMYEGEQPTNPAAAMTYQELNRQANRLAQVLRARGVDPEARVALYVERSFELVIGILGILKAGGAYVPLDPDYPEERLAFMLSDAQCSIVLTQPHLQARLPLDQLKQTVQVLTLTTGQEIVGIALAEAVASAVIATNLAYIIYTSGSTGRPKGTMLDHRSLVNYLAAIERDGRVTCQDRVLQFASISFDTSTEEIFFALTCGAALVLRTDAMLESVPVFLQMCWAWGLTVLDMPTAYWHQVVRSIEHEETLLPHTLRAIMIAGERALPAQVSAWFRHVASDVGLVNMYGLTETAITATLGDLEEAEREMVREGEVSIGRPIANAQVYVLDAQMQPVPVGIPGELYCGGVGMARGYLHRSELTAERFVPDPFSSQSGARLYRTGDLGRWRTNGELECLGRVDQQVKLRGYRIELGEIEIVLGQHPAVSEAVVLLREDTPGEPRLVAYVVPQALSSLGEGKYTLSGEWRLFLQERLPAYMIPTTFVVLEALPLTPNRKVDRRALLAPEIPHSTAEATYAAPRTQIEEALVGIWAQVLGVKQVGISDNFFELGGDSILCIQVVARAAQAGLRLTPRQIFQHQTIAELSVLVGAAPAVTTEQGLVTGSVPLTPIQHWFFEQQLPEQHYFNQSLLLLVRRPLTFSMLRRVVAHLLVHHDALRLRFVYTEAGWRQRHAGSEAATLEAASAACLYLDLSALPTTEQVAVLTMAAAAQQANLNLEKGPLLRVVFFTSGPDQPSRLLLAAHHLVVDGVSWRILLEDMQHLIEQDELSLPLDLPAKTTSFQRWAEQLAQYAQSEALLQEKDYWLALASVVVKPLPVDHLEGVNTIASARSVQVSLSAEETQALLQEVPRAYHTQINEALLAGLLLTCTRWTNQRHLLVNLEGHGREDLFPDVDLSRTVGWFTSLFPLLLMLEGDDSAGAVLMSVKEQLRRIPQHGLGYGVLSYLNPSFELRQQLAALPQAELTFNYLGQLDQAMMNNSWMQAAPESAGPSRSRYGERSVLLEVSARVVDGRLNCNWVYSEHIHERATIEKLAGQYLEALRQFIVHCQAPEAGGYTPADFPLASLDQAQLDQLLGLDRQIEDVYPLSPMQEGMLFHSLYEPATGAYVVQKSYRLQGGLDAAALRQAWLQVVTRYDLLRTSFHWQGLAASVQVVHGQVALPWDEQDWRSLSAPEQEEQLQVLLQADHARGFELSQAPLLRLTLLRLSEESYQFIWTSHHILYDGWSMPILLKEVFACYQSICKGETAIMPPARPYRDYIAWLQQQDGAAAEVFWRQALADFTTPTSLLVGRHATNVVSAPQHYAEERLLLSEALSAALPMFAREQQLTLNTVIQGAWALLLSRYSGQQDVVFGAIVSGRPAELVGVAGMVGLFINTLPVRVRMQSAAKLGQWLEALQGQQVELRQYEYSPLAQVQGWSGIPRGQALFESLLDFENYPVGIEDLQDSESLHLQRQEAHDRTTYALTVTVRAGRQMLVEISYDCDRYEQETIGRMLRHLCVLLEGMVARPTAYLFELPLLTGEELRQQLEEWNESQEEQRNNEYQPDQCIHQIFEAQVDCKPDAVALLWEQQSLTFGELNRRVNQFAHYLRGLGVRNEARVGIYMERCPELIVAVWGTLKAGGVFVPLDPTYPAERLGFILIDAQVIALVTKKRLVAELPEHHGQVICVDSDWEMIGQASAMNLDIGVTCRQPGYIIYTSGSTGRPKGVMVTHANLVSAYYGWESAYRLESSSACYLQMASFSFDVFAGDLVRSFCFGVKLMLGPQEVLLDPKDLYELLCREGVDTAEFVPAVLRKLIPYLKERGQTLSFMRLLVVGSDLWYGKEYQEVLELCGPETRLINSYGVTEATVDSTYFEGPASSMPADGPVFIGRPFVNSEIYILDSWLRPTPIGVPGELYIGGTGLAIGYLNRPDLTAELFSPHPFASQAGKRLYRTGDQACYQPDGSIAFLGRVDRQVTLHGYRIELGEIEETLRQHPTVLEVVVLLYEETSADTQLVAYIVPRASSQDTTPTAGGAQAASSAWRRFLQERLPAYMAPGAFVILEALPLTPNGKVDRRALPAPQIGQSAPPTIHTAERTPTEELLMGIWSQVLGREQIGIFHNFFELGGHSLRATQVVSRLRTAFGLEAPLRWLFEAPTIAELAARVDAQLRSEQGVLPPTIPLRRQERTGELPLSFAQQRLWFLYQWDPNSPAYNIPMTMRLQGSFDVALFARCLNEVVRRHEVLRTSFPSVEGVPVQVIAPPSPLPLPLIDLTGLAATKRAHMTQQLAQAEAMLPFDLANGPLLRAHLLRLDNEEYAIFFSMHHIITDGWSDGILVQEVATLYSFFAAGQPSPLPELPIQYVDYAIWQRQWLRGEVLERQLAYWRRHLAGMPPVIQLPLYRPRPAEQSYRGAEQNFTLPKELAAALQRLSQQENTTLFMTLLAAFQALLARYSGQEDVTVGTPIANRTQTEVEDLIGFFVNTLVLRTHLDNNPTFRELLQRVRATCLEAYAHQDVPFEQLVEELQPERNLSYAPLVQVEFTLQNAPISTAELSEVRIAPLELGVVGTTARFDLALVMYETGREVGGTLEYCTDLFEAETMTRLLAHFQTLLETMVSNPDQRVSEAPLLTDIEREQLLVQWNATITPSAPRASFQELFAQQVARTPDAVALIAPGVQLTSSTVAVTYQELDRRATHLARELIERGVGPERLVAILAERDVPFVICILGIFKAGGAYLPLDVAHPPKRLAQIIQQSHSHLLLSDYAHHSLLEAALAQTPANARPLLLALEQVAEDGAVAEESLPQICLEPHQLAYVIYTSGSTGTPKGAMIEQAGMLNHLCAKISDLRLTASDTVAQTAPVCFDISVWQMLAALIVGGRVQVIPQQVVTDPEQLLVELEHCPITILEVVPSLLEALLATRSAEVLHRLDMLRWVLATGEALPPTLCRAWFERYPTIPLINAYGPTECSDDVTHALITQSPPPECGFMPIGRPIANMRMYVLDSHLQPLPVGVPGELYVGGIGVGRGYLEEGRRTAEAFVPDSFAFEMGGRLYRTGDLVSYQSDGSLVYLGRVDHQVKLRGYRIELGEIEETLRQHLAVREVVVLVRQRHSRDNQRRKDAPGEQQLVAYVVPRVADIEALDKPVSMTNLLRAYLQEQLPDYMVPSVFVQLETLPLTPNGKLDRQALPPPDREYSALVESYVAPRTLTEELVAAVWSQILDVKQVGIHDNFFELGGHSLLATQVVARLRSTLSLEIPLPWLFDSPTIAELAVAIDNVKNDSAYRVSRGITRVSREAHRVQRSSLQTEGRKFLGDR